MDTQPDIFIGMTIGMILLGILGVGLYAPYRCFGKHRWPRRLGLDADLPLTVGSAVLLALMADGGDLTAKFIRQEAAEALPYNSPNPDTRGVISANRPVDLWQNPNAGSRYLTTVTMR